MFDYLILTEKKSAFDNFVAALGGESGTVNGHTYQLTHAQGHLLEFLDPVDQVAPNLKDKYESWELKDLPWNLQDFAWRKKAKNGSAQKMIKKLLMRVVKHKRLLLQLIMIQAEKVSFLLGKLLMLSIGEDQFIVNIMMMRVKREFKKH